jgi:GNAT superfamily N-acetyltransferase
MAVGSVLREPPPGFSGSGSAWRVRGMAARADVRGCGFGAKVLDALIAHVLVHGGDLVWCTARVPAVGFYERFGFVAQGGPRDVRGLGPHLFMSKSLLPEPPT